MRQKSIKQALIRSLYVPFQLLFLDMMVLVLCLYSAIILGILYLFFGAFPLVFRVNYDFELWQTGLTFMGLIVGSLFAVATNPLWHKNYVRLVTNWRKTLPKAEENKRPDPEFRLPPAILGGVLVPIGLFWFGWTTYRSVHWIVPIIGTVFFGGG